MATLCGEDTKRLVAPQYKQSYINTQQHAYIHTYESSAYIHTNAHRYVYIYIYIYIYTHTHKRSYRLLHMVRF